uniref:Uncharacterized protein n=1 Tax=Romanomermis culicivorax TaxID=13658 RepID=A0A915IBF6_ROMCU
MVWAPSTAPALSPPPPRYVTPVMLHPSMTPKMSGHISVVMSYRPKETATVTAAVAVAPALPANFAAQGPWPGIPMDSTLEVIGQLESMNLM